MKPALPSLSDLRTFGVLSPLDQYFALELGRLAGEDRPQVLLAVALACRQVSRGHVCLDLGRVAVSGALGADEESGAAGSLGALLGTERPDDLTHWPNAEGWLSAVRSSPLVLDAGLAAQPSPITPVATRLVAGAEAEPLVLDSRGRLYLRRFFEEEARLVEDLTLRMSEASGEVAIDPQAAAERNASRESIERLLPRSPEEPRDEPCWPRVAAAIAASSRLTIVCGGPGTGKTTTAARLLAVLVEQALRIGEAAPAISLLAPTGKAAARLGEAIARAKQELDCEAHVRDAIPSDASTIHRALGARPRGGFRHDRHNPLPAKVVLVDEASMIDLELMVRLVDATAPDAQLVLLGDPDQLASVAPGSVLGDLCGAPDERLRSGEESPARSPSYSQAQVTRLNSASGETLTPFAAGAASEVPAIADRIVTLTHSHRFGADTAIGELARCVNAGDADTALALLESGDAHGVTRVEPAADGLSGALRDAALAGYSPLLRAEDAAEKLELLGRFRVLCALREGPFGVVSLNRRIDALLVSDGLLPAIDRGSPDTAPGRPLLVTRNAPGVDLYNGDVGVLVHAEGRLRALFPDALGGVRRVPLARLPAHEGVFAMTVHKSQGSEFDRVEVVLPDHISQIGTRELLYTAITRARERVVVHASQQVLRAAIERRVERASGLRDALWGETR